MSSDQVTQNPCLSVLLNGTNNKIDEALKRKKIGVSYLHLFVSLFCLIKQFIIDLESLGHMTWKLLEKNCLIFIINMHIKKVHSNKYNNNT